jgi:hypothetical protein
MEESPGSTGIRCRLTAGGGDPRESATENKPPEDHGKPWAKARVKRCGKSAPRGWQQQRQGKPHREQDRVGAAGRVLRHRGQGHSRPAARVGRARRAVTRVPEEWLPLAVRSGQNPAYRPSGFLRTHQRERVPSTTLSTDPPTRRRAVQHEPHRRYAPRFPTFSRANPFDAHVIPC